MKKINQIATYIHDTSDIEGILNIEKRYLNPCLNCTELCEADKTPANKHIDRQNFFSTKRKRSSKVRMGKPTIKEKNKIVSELLDISILIPESELSKLD